MATASEASQQANRSAMDPKRLVVIFLLLAGIVTALFFEHVLGLIWARFSWSDPSLVEGVDLQVSTLVGYLLTLGLVIFAWLNPKSHALAIDIASELMKVTWPTWPETRTSTVAVVIASLVAAIILFCIDTIAYNMMVEWLPAVWGKL
jgi:preprotein translocase subunit SecE